MKHRFFVLMAALCIAGVGLASCSYGTNYRKKLRMTTTRELTYFKRIVLLAPYDVHFVQGGKSEAKMIGTQEELKNIILRVSGETLYIERVKKRGFSFGKDSEVDIYLTSPDLIALEMKGSGDFSVIRKMDTDVLTVSLIGSGDVKFGQVICDQFRVSLNGSGDVKFDGVSCQRAEVRLKGSGDMTLKQLQSDRVEFSLYGSGDIEAGLQNCGAVKTELFGSGDIKLWGSTRSLDKTVHGSGEIQIDRLNVR